MASFFDKVVVGINKGVNAVSETSKNFAEKAKLNVMVSDTEKEMSKLCQSIGMLVYNLHKNGGIEVEQANGMFEDMDKLTSRLEELKESIKALEGEKPNQTEACEAPAQTACTCGHVNIEGAKFCAKCGSQL